jgi:ankyrin repeat protein
MLAANMGHEAAMKVLLQKGADLTVQTKVSE